jgi:hypothetical protein
MLLGLRQRNAAYHSSYGRASVEFKKLLIIVLLGSCISICLSSGKMQHVENVRLHCHKTYTTSWNRYLKKRRDLSVTAVSSLSVPDSYFSRLMCRHAAVPILQLVPWSVWSGQFSSRREVIRGSDGSFSYYYGVQASSWAHLAAGMMSFFQGDKRQRHPVTHFSPTSAEVKNAWSFAFTCLFPCQSS